MFDALNATWKKLRKVHGRFCKKLKETPNCATNGFAEMRIGRESRRGECIGDIVKCWYRMRCLDPEEPPPPKKKNSVTNGRRVILNARSWTMQLIEGGAEEYRITICVGEKQQQRNVREIIKTVKYRCNVI